MSDNLYATRLRWAGGRGVAKLHGISVRLATAPDLGAGPVNEVDYTPEVGAAEIRRRASDARDDMTAAEITAADALLKGLVDG